MMGNPVIKKIKNYRKMFIIKIVSLRFNNVQLLTVFSLTLVSHAFVFVYIQEFRYYILHGVCLN